MNRATQPHRGNGFGSHSEEIERDIERTRQEMDETLDELGERLSPRHLLDELIDMFRSEGAERGRRFATTRARSAATQAGKKAARVAGRQVARTVREHPLPSLLIGAGVAWMIYDEMCAEEDSPDFHSQWADIPEHSGSFVDARTGEPYDETYGREWRGAAWSKDYDWSQSSETEEAWLQRANRELAELRAILADESIPARDRMQAASARLLLLSRVRRHLHEQWDNLHEHGGSFVDARTGEPYDEAYLRECEALMACDFAASHEWSHEDEHTWTEKAKHALEEMQQTLADTSTSVKDRTRALAEKVRDFVGATRGTAEDFGHAMRDRTARAASSTRRGAHRLAAGTRHGAERMAASTRRGATQVGRQARRGYRASRDQIQEAMDESPLAVGAACLGLGLLAGLLLPHTRQEDRLMGDASDRLKRRAKETAKEAAQRGRHVAEATAGAALDEMERQGITPEQIADTTQRAVTSAKGAIQGETGGTAAATDRLASVAQRAMETAKDETKKQASEMRQ